MLEVGATSEAIVEYEKAITLAKTQADITSAITDLKAAKAKSPNITGADAILQKPEAAKLKFIHAT